MPLIIGNHYDFSTQASAILGTGYTNAKLLAVLDYSTASKFQADLLSKHVQALPELLVGTPSDVNVLTFYYIKTVSAQYRLVAKEWLSGDPVESVVSRATFVVEDISPAGIILVRGLLQANGFYNYKVTTE